MISYAADDIATMSDWFEYADAFLLGRMTAKLLASQQRPEAEQVAQADAGEGLCARTCGGSG
jgi:hypothetical protein